MPQKLSKSQLLAKQKQLTKGAWKKSRKSEAKVKGQQLPNGLIKAVAKVIDGGFTATKEKGIPYYFVKGQVVEPAELSGTKFMKMWFLNATQNKSIEEKMDEMASDLQLLGQDVEEVEENDLPALFEGLKDEDIYFEFNTWTPPADKRNPNPSTMVFIQGPADAPEGADEEPEEDETEEGGDEGEDAGEDEAEVPSKTGSGKRSKTSKPAAKSGKGKKAKDEKEPEEEEEEETEDEGDEGEGEDGADDGEEEAADEPWEPAVKEVYYYKAGPKAKLEEVAVLKVDKKNETVKVKRLRDDKIFPTVAWDDLKGEE